MDRIYTSRVPLMNLKKLLFSLRPMFGRGAGGIGKSFDARQKIGVNDVRQRLGGGAGAAAGKGHYYFLDK